MQALKDLFSFVLEKWSEINIEPIDVLDIAIVSVIFYYLFKFISDRRAGKLAVGVLFIIGVLLISDIFNMRTLNFLVENVVQVGIIGLVILFQAELRSFLEKVGGSNIIGSFNKRNAGDMQKIMECINSVAEVCVDFSETKTGALIVFERDTKIGDVIRTGTIIDSSPAPYLIKNIFFNKAPLHDGALIIRNFRLYSAGCFLPLSQKEDIIKDLGTRHRAAIGMSENSDAVIVVVSEETGAISIAVGGELKRDFNEQSLKDELTRLIVTAEDNKPLLKVHTKN